MILLDAVLYWIKEFDTNKPFCLRYDENENVPYWRNFWLSLSTFFPISGLQSGKGWRYSIFWLGEQKRWEHQAEGWYLGFYAWGERSPLVPPQLETLHIKIEYPFLEHYTLLRKVTPNFHFFPPPPLVNLLQHKFSSYIQSSHVFKMMFWSLKSAFEFDLISKKKLVIESVIGTIF